MPTLTIDKIEIAAFDHVAQRYASTVPQKFDERELELEKERYFGIPRSIERGGTPASLSKDQAEHLVEWKLKHGTFRPKLLQLVQSNDAGTIKQSTQDAFKHIVKYESVRPGWMFHDNDNFIEDVMDAVKILTKLKGIGPATASLLLSVAHPSRVPFFSDEVFRWCMWDAPGSPDGWKRKIKYNVKEYEELLRRMNALVGRLNVRAVDVERFAYVLGKEGVDVGAGEEDSNAEPAEKDIRPTGNETYKERKATKQKETEKEKGKEKTERGTKRKEPPSEPPAEGTRKSTRTKK